METKEMKLLKLVMLLALMGALVASIAQAYENKPAIYIYDGINYSELAYYSYSSEKVGQSDLSRLYLERRLGIEMGVSDKDVPMEIKIKQTSEEYSVFINSPGVYKIPLPGLKGGKISADFKRCDGLHHILEIQPEDPQHSALFSPLSEPESGESREVI